LCSLVLLGSGDPDHAIARYRRANDGKLPWLDAHVAGLLGAIAPGMAVTAMEDSDSVKAKDVASLSTVEAHLRRREPRRAVALLNRHFRSPHQFYDGIRYAVRIGTLESFPAGNRAGEQWLDGFLSYARRYGADKKKGICMRAAMAGGYLSVAPRKAQPLLKDLQAAGKAEDVELRACALACLAYLDWVRKDAKWQAAWKEAIAANEAAIAELKKQGRYDLKLVSPVPGFPDPDAVKELARTAPGFVAEALPGIPEALGAAERAFLLSVRMDVAARHDAKHNPQRAIKVLAATKAGLPDDDLRKQRCGVYVALIRAGRYAEEN
jgi:hypothetical protein